MNWFKLVPIKYLVRKLPDILGYILTKVLTWTLTKYPSKAAKVQETMGEITAAMASLVLAAKDGVITGAEVEEQKRLWTEVFK